MISITSLMPKTINPPFCNIISFNRNIEARNMKKINTQSSTQYRVMITIPFFCFFVGNFVVQPKNNVLYTLRGVGAADRTNRSCPTLLCIRDDEIWRPMFLQLAFDATPATRAHAADVFVSSIGTPLAKRCTNSGTVFSPLGGWCKPKESGEARGVGGGGQDRLCRGVLVCFLP